MGDRSLLNSSLGMKALGLGRAKVIQDNSISAPGSKVQTVSPLDLEKASQICPQAQLGAP